MQPELQPIHAGNPASTQEYALRQHRVLRNTYWLLAISLIPTVIGAAIGTNIDLGFLRASPALSFFAILAIFYGWIFAIERNRNSSLGVAWASDCCSGSRCSWVCCSDPCFSSCSASGTASSS